MICRNCRAEIDDNLTFCTNCGIALESGFTPPSPAVLTSEQTVIKPTVQNTPPSPSRSNSSLKWAALILALIALPASLGIVYLLLNSQKDSPPVVRQTNSAAPAPANHKAGNNSAKPAANASNSVNDKADSNHASPVLTNQNANSAVNADTIGNPANSGKRTSVFNERIDLAAGEEATYYFTLETEAKIIGEAQVLTGEGVEGYVFFQEVFSEHSLDPQYKVFNLDEKTLACEQTLVKGDYVLVFVNRSSQPIALQGNFYTVK